MIIKALENEKVPERQQRGSEWRKKNYKATGFTCILCIHRRDSVQYIINCKMKCWLDHHPRPRLATGWRT